MNSVPYKQPVMPPKKKKRAHWDAILISALVHGAIIAGAITLTVMVIQGRQKVTFQAKKTPSIPARKLEHSIRVKQMQKQVRKPQILQKLVARGPSQVSLPDMPKLEAPDIKTMRDRRMSSSLAGQLGGLGSVGGGAGRGLTGGGGYSDTKFFGANVRTRGLCILVDVSASIVAKGVLDDVKKEAAMMLAELSPVTRFNLVAFVDGAEPFADQMVFATQEHKTSALKWLDSLSPNKSGNRSGFSGSTPSEAIRLAVEQGCDTMFVITDDPPYLKEGTSRAGVEVPEHAENIHRFARHIDTEYGRSVKINTILYKPRESEMGKQAIDFYKKLARIGGGRFQVVRETASDKRK